MYPDDFLPLFYQYHEGLKRGALAPAGSYFPRWEDAWLACYDLGKLETYQFIYSNCTDAAHFRNWLLQRKDEAQLQAAAVAFTQLLQGLQSSPKQDHQLLTAEQLQTWQEQGYLRVPALVPAEQCNAVISLICNKLGATFTHPASWYHEHPDWHGLMLHLFQEAPIQAIRNLPAIRQVFAELYGNDQLLANTEKVSFNPPETEGWKFRHSALHWDIDFANIDLHYIQGLVYLNDVPENRGPLQVVSGFHHQFQEWMKRFPDPHTALEAVRRVYTGTPVPGKQGDLLLWLQTLPHAASANHDTLPRCVQYVSFTRTAQLND